MELQFVLRDIQPSDYDFVASVWLRQARKDMVRKWALDRWLEFPEFQSRIGAYIANQLPKSKVTVAASAYNPDTIYGFCMRGRRGFRLSFVKKIYRCKEIEDALEACIEQ